MKIQTVEDLRKWEYELEHRICNMYEGTDEKKMWMEVYENAKILKSKIASSETGFVLESSEAYKNLLQIQDRIQTRYDELSEGLVLDKYYYFLINDQQEEKSWLAGYIQRCRDCVYMGYALGGPGGAPIQFKSREALLESLERVRDRFAIDDVLATNGPPSIETRLNFLRSCLNKKEEPES